MNRMKLLTIITFAAFENGLLNFDKYDKFTSYFESNGTPILSKSSMKSDVEDGLMIISKQNPDDKEYYDAYLKYLAGL